MNPYIQVWNFRKKLNAVFLHPGFEQKFMLKYMWIQLINHVIHALYSTYSPDVYVIRHQTYV
jgi:hypothetical protein